VAGINGRMGRASVACILADDGLELVAAIGKPGADYIGRNLSEVLFLRDLPELKVSGDVEASLVETKPDVLLDFTVAGPAVESACLAIEKSIHPVVGTSGIEPDLLARIEEAAAKAQVGAMVVPNFSLGAVMMMEFARQAGKHFENAEIIEMHHTGKVDAPSGTAMHTARKLAEHEKVYNDRRVQEHEILTGARGALHGSGVRVHSLRLPGLISHQEVIFGSDGELLTIKHDSFNTNCFTRGIILSIKSVVKMKSLVVGLENLL
ncbi:MAG: 4-hydroxy-tetrahydrodipicolinate reductase, partial [Cyanobacteria bacterium]|nr:4-hydroxy-tetrahydrodipicolinate reductase [Cyanobacteriota bacterium]